MTLLGIVLLAALSRVVPHPWNATPVAAIALFSGAYFANKKLAYLVPLIAMFLGDLVLGFYPTLPVTYLCFAAAVWIGGRLQSNKSVVRVGGAALAASLMFFLVTNFSCWLTMPEYSKDLSGFFACYARAIPFFRNTLGGDMVFTALLFGSFALSEKTFPKLRETAQPA